MSDRFKQQDNTANNPPSPCNGAANPTNGEPHPAATPSMSHNAPKCPVIQKIALPEPLYIISTPSIPAPKPIPTDIPDYTPAEQDAPAPEDPPLSPQQQQAIFLLQGLSDTAVAKRLDLDRKTIYRWKWHTPLFYNTLDEAQRQSWNEAYGLLRSSILQSAQKLNYIIKKGKPQDAIKAARVLLSAPVLTRLEGQ